MPNQAVPNTSFLHSAEVRRHVREERKLLAQEEAAYQKPDACVVLY
jgi:hypothetical protein